MLRHVCCQTAETLMCYNLQTWSWLVFDLLEDPRMHLWREKKSPETIWQPMGRSSAAASLKTAELIAGKQQLASSCRFWCSVFKKSLWRDCTKMRLLGCQVKRRRVSILAFCCLNHQCTNCLSSLSLSINSKMEPCWGLISSNMRLSEVHDWQDKSCVVCQQQSTNRPVFPSWGRHQQVCLFLFFFFLSNILFWRTITLLISLW